MVLGADRLWRVTDEPIFCPYVQVIMFISLLLAGIAAKEALAAIAAQNQALANSWAAVLTTFVSLLSC